MNHTCHIFGVHRDEAIGSELVREGGKRDRERTKQMKTGNN